jgi:bacterioferritin-associated ferredoxin
MYVCLCHGLTTRDITHHARNGCGSVAGVYKQLGCRPQCGKCVKDVRRLVQSSWPAQSFWPAPTDIAHWPEKHCRVASHGRILPSLSSEHDAEAP